MSNAGLPFPCGEDPNPGINSFCKAMHPRHYYDANKNDCIAFFYGGCGANENLFSTKNDCERACKK